MPKLTVSLQDNFRFVPDKSVDFILTDPPFNISKKSNFHTYKNNTIHSYQFDGESDESWDTYTHEEFLVKLDDWSKEWNRVLRNGGNFAIFCADAYISHLMEALKNNNLSPRRIITWRKNNAVPVNRAYMPMSANEYIVVGVKGKGATFNADVKLENQSLDDQIIESTIVADKVSTLTYAKIKEAIMARNTLEGETAESHLVEILKTVDETLGTIPQAVLSKVEKMYKRDKGTEELYLQACVPNYAQNPLKVGNRIHPTEKPVPLLEYLVALYSNPNDVILDGFAGSGSTGEAALLLGRDAILVERENSFYNRMCSRFQDKEDIEVFEIS